MSVIVALASERTSETGYVTISPNGSRFKCEKVRGSYFGTSNQRHAGQCALEMSERFSSLATAWLCLTKVEIIAEAFAYIKAHLRRLAKATKRGLTLFFDFWRMLSYLRFT